MENMGKTLDRNLFTEPVLMHLSKAFDCIPQDLPIAKLYAFGFNFVFRAIENNSSFLLFSYSRKMRWWRGCYGLGFNTVTFSFIYLKELRQKVSINNISSLFETVLYGVLQDSILGPFLFDIFLNYLFLWLKNSDLYNFSEDNTVAVTCNNLTNLCHRLEKDSESAIEWFKNNS